MVTRKKSGQPQIDWDDPEVRARYLARANVARWWNYLSGGKNPFAHERDLFTAQSYGALPLVLQYAAQANRQFLLRAAAYLTAQQHIAQFVVLGPGMPPDDIHIHETIQSINPASKVLYVDNDPVVLSWARANDSGRGRELVVEADVFDPATLLGLDEVMTFLDWSKPIGIISTAVLHYHPGDLADVAKVMRTYVDAIPPGSCTVISHFLDPDSDLIDARDYEVLTGLGLGTSVRFRTIEQIGELFPEQAMLAPGVVPCLYWPQEPDEASLIQTLIAGGIGKKGSPGT